MYITLVAGHSVYSAVYTRQTILLFMLFRSGWGSVRRETIVGVGGLEMFILLLCLRPGWWSVRRETIDKLVGGYGLF